MAELPFPLSRCHQCAHLRVVEARSVFLRCAHGELPKYPPQPVVTCAGFRQRDAVSMSPFDASTKQTT